MVSMIFSGGFFIFITVALVIPQEFDAGQGVT